MAKKSKAQLEAERKERLNKARRLARAERKAKEAAQREGEVEAGLPAILPKKRTPFAVVKKAKENLAEAFELMGGVRGLVKWGLANKTEFYRIWARLIPKEAAEEERENNLEDLLGMLADRGTVIGLAAMQLGPQVMGQAREQVLEEDAQAALDGLEEETMQ